MKRFIIPSLLLLLAVGITYGQGPGQWPGRGYYGFYSDYTFDAIAGVTNRLVQNTTNFPASILNLTRYGEVAFMARFRSDGLGVQNVTYRWRWSLDGTNWTTGTPPLIWVVPMQTNAGTSVEVYSVTNVTVGPIGYFQLYAIENACTTNNITNHAVWFSVKPNRWGYK